jgi:hypothetical protein
VNILGLGCGVGKGFKVNLLRSRVPTVEEDGATGVSPVQPGNVFGLRNKGEVVTKDRCCLWDIGSKAIRIIERGW